VQDENLLASKVRCFAILSSFSLPFLAFSRINYLVYLASERNRLCF
jgi:hypothetical protein